MVKPRESRKTQSRKSVFRRSATPHPRARRPLLHDPSVAGPSTSRRTAPERTQALPRGAFPVQGSPPLRGSTRQTLPGFVTPPRSTRVTATSQGFISRPRVVLYAGFITPPRRVISTQLRRSQLPNVPELDECQALADAPSTSQHVTPSQSCSATPCSTISFRTTTPRTFSLPQGFVTPPRGLITPQIRRFQLPVLQELEELQEDTDSCEEAKTKADKRSHPDDSDNDDDDDSDDADVIIKSLSSRNDSESDHDEDDDDDVITAQPYKKRIIF